jgi:hypothetical protein
VPKDTHDNAAIHYTTVYKVGSSSVLVNREWAFYPPRLGSARSGPAGGSSDTCYPSIPLQLRGASASSPSASPQVTMTQDVVTRFESHTALAEIDPNPESEADVVKIQLVFFILIEIIGR